MKVPTIDNPPDFCQIDDALDIIKRVHQRNRLELVKAFNRIYGTPSSQFSKMQYDFIWGIMNENQILEFAEVCKKLL
jgi:hypothetical protein